MPLVLELVLAIAIEDADADGQTLGELGVRAQGEVGAGRGYGFACDHGTRDKSDSAESESTHFQHGWSRPTAETLWFWRQRDHDAKAVSSRSTSAAPSTAS